MNAMIQARPGAAVSDGSAPEQQAWDVDVVRAHFPSLARQIAGRTVAYLDGPAGTQVPRECIDAVSAYFATSNANSHGAFTASHETDELLETVHAASADFLGATDPDEIAFGPNMTTLTFAVSRAIGRTIGPGDEVVVTRLDHDANVAPWLRMAEDRGATVRWVPITEECTLDMDVLESVLSPQDPARGGRAGVQRGRHDQPDSAHRRAGTCRRREALGRRASTPVRICPSTCRQLGRRLPRLLGIQVLRPASRHPVGPPRAARGATRLQGPAGGRCPPPPLRDRHAGPRAAGRPGRHVRLPRDGWEGGSAAPARRHAAREAACGGGRLARMGARPRAEAHRGRERCPRRAHPRHHGPVPRERTLRRPSPSPWTATIRGRWPRSSASAAISVWDGDYYAWELIQALGLAESGGMVRVGLVHYNTPAEIDRLVAALISLVKA